MRSALRTVGIVAVVVAVAFGYVYMAGNKGYALKKGSEAPGLRLPALAGGEMDLASQRGKVVVLNFWATWCPPCVAEMPSLERLHRALGPEGLAVVTVSTDEDEDELKRFVSRLALTLPVLKDPGGRVAASEYHTTGYPETFVLDREGRLLEHVVGPAEWDSAERIAGFRRLLEGAPAR
jgi:cytochrome c biogenesis protein CcmG, thiol:disulfide interchange protein DsbE